MTDKPFRYLDGGFIEKFQPMILTDYVIPRDYFKAQDSWFPEIQAKSQAQRLSIVKEFATTEVIVKAPIYRDPPRTGERLQMLADIDAFETTPATEYDNTRTRMRRFFDQLVRRDLEKRIMQTLRGNRL